VPEPVAEDVELRIDALYAGALDRFTPDRDALAKELRAGGDREAAERVRALRKPVVAAWALNRLAREEPKGVAELERLGRRLRDAQADAMSGGDPEPLRAATEERRALVGRLGAAARAILAREGAGGAGQDEGVASTLDAAAVDERALEALRAGRLVKPLRPPTGFGEAPELAVVAGGRRPARAAAPSEEDERDRARSVRELRRELAAAEAKERKVAKAADRARALLQEAEQRRAEAKDRLKEAETELRGATLERKRLAAAVAKLDPAQ
jgi:hypothetical protein